MYPCRVEVRGELVADMIPHQVSVPRGQAHTRSGDSLTTSVSVRFVVAIDGIGTPGGDRVATPARRPRPEAATCASAPAARYNSAGLSYPGQPSSCTATKAWPRTTWSRVTACSSAIASSRGRSARGPNVHRWPMPLTFDAVASGRRAIFDCVHKPSMIRRRPPPHRRHSGQ